MNMKQHMEAYHRWTAQTGLDPETRRQLDQMAGHEDQIYEAFYRDLAFGTAGLRGVMEPGTNRMNVYVIRRVTQGISNYLKQESPQPAVAISYDSRNHSRSFAEATASVLSANGITVWLYRQMMPVPALSFAVRHLKCQMGIMITASHNAKEYNGFKVYGRDGGQILASVADEILGHIDELDLFDHIKEMPFEEALQGTCHYISEETEEAYHQAVMALSTGEPIHDLKLVYTPLNGAGLGPVVSVLSRAGLETVHLVPEQKNPDGDFPTCPRPNPELPEVYALAMNLGMQVEADLLLATDPDSDRVGMAIPDGQGHYRVLTGNEMAILLLDYLMQKRKIPENPVIVRTIVSTPLVDKMAAKIQGEVKITLIGFKYVGEILTQMEQAGEQNRFVMGFEEGNGFLAGPYIRDKDAVGTALLLCQMAAFHKKQGTSLREALASIYQVYGFYREKVISFEFEGAEGVKTMEAIMERFREEHREPFLGKKAIRVVDYLDGAIYYLGNACSCSMSAGMRPTGLPKENILEFIYDDQTSFVVRPSGTEPKLKIYLFAKGDAPQNATEMLAELEARIRAFI